MEMILAIAIAILSSCGFWLLMRRSALQIVIGCSLLAYASNLFLFVSGKFNGRPSLLLDKTAQLRQYNDPLPQSFVLTAIVIGFAMTALLLVLLLIIRRS